jgi:hypothetical protein
MISIIFRERWVEVTLASEVNRYLTAATEKYQMLLALVSLSEGKILPIARRACFLFSQ